MAQGRIYDPRPSAAMERVRAELRRRAAEAAARQRASQPMPMPNAPFMPMGQNVTQQLMQRMQLDKPAGTFGPHPASSEALWGGVTGIRGVPPTMLQRVQNMLSSMFTPGSQVAPPAVDGVAEPGMTEADYPPAEEGVGEPFYPTPTGQAPLSMSRGTAQAPRPVGPRGPVDFDRRRDKVLFIGSEKVKEDMPEPPLLDATFGAGGGLPPRVGMTTPAQAMAMRQPPNPWGQLFGSILNGFVDQIVPATVAFAADRRNSPEIVRAWAESNALKVQQQEFAMKERIAVMQEYGDLLNAQRQYEQLELSKIQAQVSILQHARDVMKDPQTAADPMTAIKSLQGFGIAYVGAGGDAEDFAARNPLPNVQILRDLRTQADAMVRRHQKNPGVLQAANIPFMGQMLTAEEVYQMLGEVDLESGRVHIPLGVIRPSDIVTREKRDAEGRTTRFRSTMEEALGAEDIIEPSPSEGVVTYPGMGPEGELIINMLKRRAGQPITLKGQRPVNMSPLEEGFGAATRGTRDQLEAARILEKSGYTPEEIQETLSDISAEELSEILKEYR